jgi:hypothetical protein
MTINIQRSGLVHRWESQMRMWLFLGLPTRDLTWTLITGSVCANRGIKSVMPSEQCDWCPWGSSGSGEGTGSRMDSRGRTDRSQGGGKVEQLWSAYQKGWLILGRALEPSREIGLKFQSWWKVFEQRRNVVKVCLGYQLPSGAAVSLIERI